LNQTHIYYRRTVSVKELELIDRALLDLIIRDIISKQAL